MRKDRLLPDVLSTGNMNATTVENKGTSMELHGVQLVNHSPVLPVLKNKWFVMNS